MKKLLTSTLAICCIAVLSSCASVGGSMNSAELAALKGQTTGVDMQGNVVELDGFTYGGDNMAAYNKGLIATGAKDPAVCGSFAAAKCSVGHLK